MITFYCPNCADPAGCGFTCECECHEKAALELAALLTPTAAPAAVDATHSCGRVKCTCLEEFEAMIEGSAR